MSFIFGLNKDGYKLLNLFLCHVSSEIMLKLLFHFCKVFIGENYKCFVIAASNAVVEFNVSFSVSAFTVHIVNSTYTLGGVLTKVSVDCLTC